MASRSIVLAGVAAVAIAGAGAYYLYFMDDAPPPQIAAPAKPVPPAPKAEMAPTPPSAAAPGAPAAKPPAGPPSPDDVKAAQSRVSDLEKSVADLQDQIAMKNKAIAELEAKLAKSK